jgi:protocadherin-16/23
MFWPCGKNNFTFKCDVLFPLFPQVAIPESVPLGYSVLTVSATDVESSENISYRILSSSKEFSIDPVNGELFIVL